jgi:hypothetical protein
MYLDYDPIVPVALGGTGTAEVFDAYSGRVLFTCLSDAVALQLVALLEGSL